MSNHTFDAASDDFSRGMTDGYNGFDFDTAGSADYVAGYNVGNQQWTDDMDAEREAQEQADQQAYDAEAYYSDAEMGMYDDDPNPYHGDYSEM